MKYKPPVTRGVGGFFSNTPGDDTNDEAIMHNETDNIIITTIEEKVQTYYQTYKEKPNTLIIGVNIFKDINIKYIKYLKIRCINIVLLPDSSEIMIGKTI